MKYLSKRGEFDSLQQLRAAYLKSSDGEPFWLDRGPFGQHDWKPDVLHASELGGCPRAVAYRLLKTPEKPRSASSEANRTIMFHAGNSFHNLTFSALKWAGLLDAHEIAVKLAQGWTGRADALFTPNHEVDEVCLYDLKTVLPAALKYSYDMPKEKDCLQLGCYASVLECPKGIIEYADRAGSNTPKECEIDLAKWSARAVAKMTVMEAARDNLPELPETLPQTYSASYSKGEGGRMWLSTVNLVTPWMCGYCDYHLTKKESRINPNSGRSYKYGWTQKDSTCHPVNLPPLTVATWKNGSLVNVKGDEDAIVAWMADQVTNYIPEEEE